MFKAQILLLMNNSVILYMCVTPTVLFWQDYFAMLLISLKAALFFLLL